MIVICLTPYHDCNFVIISPGIERTSTHIGIDMLNYEAKKWAKRGRQCMKTTIDEPN